MFIFIRLLLAHFIGDYPLQVNKVYALKFKGIKGVVPHSLIVTICLIVFSWPYLRLPGLWVFIFLIGITHLFQDWIKVKWSKIKEGNYFWFYLLDQFLHITLIAAVFLTGLKDLQPPKDGANLIISFYNNDTALLYLMAAIVATYNGFYMITNFKKTFFGLTKLYTPFEKRYGMIERLTIVSVFFFGGLSFFLVPVVLFARPLIFALGSARLDIDTQFVSIPEAVMSWIVAAASGMIFYLAI